VRGPPTRCTSAAALQEGTHPDRGLTELARKLLLPMCPAVGLRDRAGVTGLLFSVTIGRDGYHGRTHR